MHICHCFKTFSLTVGGVEQDIRYLSQEYIKAGHKVTVITARALGCSGRETIDGIEEIRTTPLFTVFKVPIMPNYYRCLTQVNADIIHAHGTCPGVSDIAVIYALNKSRPCVLNYRFDGNADSAIGTVFADLYNCIVNPAVVSRATRVVATSKSYAETSPVLKRFLNKVEIIPNGVDLVRFNPGIETGDIREKYNLPANEIIFFAGRFVEYKGLEYVIRAMKHVQHGILVVAGTGPLEKHLKQIVAEQNLTNVRFLGLIAHEELPRLYKVSEVHVLPAITRGENFGNSALEAMACGTPVIASNLPGVKELVTDDCGIKTKPKDIQGIADSINLLLANANLRVTMGQAARRNAEKYSWANAAHKFMKIYEEALNAME